MRPVCVCVSMGWVLFQAHVKLILQHNTRKHSGGVVYVNSIWQKCRRIFMIRHPNKTFARTHTSPRRIGSYKIFAHTFQSNTSATIGRAKMKQSSQMCVAAHAKRQPDADSKYRSLFRLSHISLNMTQSNKNGRFFGRHIREKNIAKCAVAFSVHSIAFFAHFSGISSVAPWTKTHFQRQKLAFYSVDWANRTRFVHVWNGSMELPHWQQQLD